MHFYLNYKAGCYSGGVSLYLHQKEGTFSGRRILSFESEGKLRIMLLFDSEGTQFQKVGLYLRMNHKAGSIGGGHVRLLDSEGR